MLVGSLSDDPDETTCQIHIEKSGQATAESSPADTTVPPIAHLQKPANQESEVCLGQKMKNARAGRPKMPNHEKIRRNEMQIARL